MPPENICDDIEDDEFYKSFLTEKRDGNANTSSLTISDQIKKLTDGLEIISFELQSQVREQHGALLSQASHAGRLDSSLNTVIGHMDRLQAGANRLRNHIGNQFALVESQTKVLGRLHDASHILRSCGNLLHLAIKLKNTRDPTKQAAILFELEPLVEDITLNKVDFVRDDRAYVLSSRQRLNNLAQEDLLNGLRDGKEAQVTSSIQIFVNLQTINKCVDNLIKTFLREIAHSIKECFAGTDVATLNASKLSQSESSKDLRQTASSAVPKGPGKAPSLTTSQHFRTKLWKSLNWLITDEIYNYCQQIALLQKCLGSEFQTSYIFNGKEDVQTKFYQRLENLLRNSFSECAPHIGQCLQEGLPNLLSATKALEMKLPSGNSFSENMFESLEAGYLSKCGANLKATLLAVDCPTNENVDNLIRAASTELSAAMVDDRLSIMVAAAFNSCNKDLWSKIEANVKLGTDSKQVVLPPNAAQTQNTNFANIVHYHNEAVKRMISNLGERFSQAATESILKNLEQGRNLVLAILQQLIESTTSTVGIILLSMHREPGLNGEKLSTSGPSLYMKELQDFLQRTWSLHMVPFADQVIVLECGQQLAGRCIELFVNNLVILRPISSAGRNRLKNDCNHMESALIPIVDNLSNIGKPFRLLRAMSSLITQTPEQLVQQEIEQDGLISCHFILFLLFTHAGSELQSPHIAANWSNERLIQWLDGHTSDKERLELVAGALQRYRDMIRRKNSTQYDPVYPLLSSYFEKAYKVLIEKSS